MAAMSHCARGGAAPSRAALAWHWDAICITARVPAHAEAYRRELQRRRGAATHAHGGQPCLVLATSDPGQDDPAAPASGRIGSGGATLNALLLIAEHLSALQGENTVDMAVLQGKRLLVLHCGGTIQRVPAFSLLPPPLEPGGGDRPLSTIDLLLDALTGLSSRCPVGLFVVSSEDSFTRVGGGFCERFGHVASRSAGTRGAATAVAMALPVSDIAGKHGAYELAGGEEVRRIHYRAAADQLRAAALLGDSPSGTARAAKVCGVVFFDEVAATKLLHLAFDPVFEVCSYLGIDNGAQPHGFSLYLDLLACLGKDISAAEFCKPTALEGQVHVDEAIRAQLWQSLHGQIDLRAVVVEPDDPSQYLYVRSLQDFVRLLTTLEEESPGSHGGRTSNLGDTGATSGTTAQEVVSESRQAASRVVFTDDCVVDGSAFVVNSLLTGCRVEQGAIVESSILQGCLVGSGAICSGLKRVTGLEVPPGLSLQQVSLLSSPGPTQVGGEGSSCVVTLHLADEAKQSAAFVGTFLSQSWDELLLQAGIVEADLWDADTDIAARTLRSARLFPVVQEVKQGSLCFLWAEYAAAVQQTPVSARDAHLDLWRRRWVQVWRHSPRISLGAVMAGADVGVELEWQDTVAAELNVLRARQLLLQHRSMPLRHIVDDEVRRQRWGLLEVFDEVAAAADTPLDVAARALAQVAEVLAAFGGVYGGLRSGMARNPQWRGALQRLAAQDPGSRRSAVLEMKELRSKWICDGPVALLRAARHYEAAAQVLILSAVATCSEFVAITPAAELRPAGQWVVVEAPARIDLAGGWTDTPPVCYTHGGVVVNLALRVDGQRPLGAMAQRLGGRLELVLETRSRAPSSGGGGSGTKASDAPPVVCRVLEDLDDHNSPGAPASLLKCCVLCCNVVSLAVGAPPLQEQLRAAGGGLHIVSWSALPQGSGLGSSSALAGVVMKAILVAFGLDMDIHSLIHAVQNVEQMLTTGGGWQDQVGAILGGAKITRSKAQLPLHVVPELLPMEPAFAEELARRMVLVFTGRPRLAKNLLQNVIRQWFAQMPEICRTVRGLVANAEAAAEAIRAGDLPRLGGCVSTYWGQKMVMAPGSEPQPVAALRERLMPGLLGFTLAGAGGGGFAMIITREPDAQAWVREALQAIPGLEAAYVSEATVDFDGMTVQPCEAAVP